MIKKFRLLLILSLFFITFYFVKLTIAAWNAPPPVSGPSELMAQGKARTCLAPTWLNLPEERGVVKNVQVTLKGTCASPTGCSCIMSWGSNAKVAQVQDPSWEGCDMQKDTLLENLKKNVKKWANMLKKGADIEDYLRSQSNSCHKILWESGNSVLSGIKPGFSKCHIIKNNRLAISNSNKNNTDRQVLGATDSNIIPPGQVDIVVDETTYRHTPVDFSAVGDLPSNSTSENLGKGEKISNDDASQKLGMIEFFSKAFHSDVKDLKTKCTSITWDPYGRVFDAQSLEPISNVEVTLIDDKTKQPALMEFNYNNDYTGEDGLFNIQVEKEGNYQLKAIPVTAHSFVFDPGLSPYWSKIYSDLYYPNKVFFEKTGVPTHHDIAFKSDTEPYQGAVAEIVPGTLKSENFGDYIVYRGRETFPMAKVCLVEEDTGKIIDKCVNANNIGSFTIAVPKSQVPQKRVAIKLNKVNLNNPDLYNANQKKEDLNVGSIVITDKTKEKTYVFEPILSHVEGYVYGKNNQKIPGADVIVKLSMNNQIFYQTKADDSGFFTIFNKNLPYLEYYLEFVNPKTQEKITKTTSEFVFSNQSYLESEKINLMQATKQNKEIINPATGKLNNIVKDGNPSKLNNQIQTSTKYPINSVIIMIILIIFLLVIVTIGLIFYIKKVRS